jgi:hypothetical protein
VEKGKHTSEMNLTKEKVNNFSIVTIDGRVETVNSPAIKEIFVISGFSTLLRIFDTKEEALEQ